MPPKKKLVKTFTLQLPAGQATPAPPVGPALGQHGVNIMDFVKRYNAETESQRGDIVPAQISVYEDRSFTFREIAEKKMSDLNANEVEQAEKIIAGTARSMGITIKE